METVTHTLNGTSITFDKKTGAVISLFNEGCGEIIQNGKGLINVAWPKKYEYEILRASPTGKHGGAPVSIDALDGKIVLSYPLLAQNTVTPELPELAGGVAAEITLAACGDGKSIALSCRVKNNSETPVRQVLFPDLSGLQPVAGKENTRFTGLRAYTTPFTELDDEACKKNPSYVSASPIPLFYAEKPSLCGKFYPANRHLQMDIRVGRYYDYGGLCGGISMFCRHWGFGPDHPDTMGAQDVVWVKLDNPAQSLRIANVHDVTLEKGQEYTSPAYILTPHPGGWAQGVAPYKQWVDVAVPLDGVRRIGDDRLKRLVVPVERIGQRVAVSDVEFIVINVVQEHIDAAQVVGGDVDLLPKKALAYIVLAKNLRKFQQQ
jgi:hypothetical protein